MSDSESDDSLRLTLSPPGSHTHSEPSSAAIARTEVIEDNAAVGPATPYHGGMQAADVYGYQRAAAGSSRRVASGSQRRPVMMTERIGLGGTTKEARIDAPYPWAAERRAGVETLEALRGKGIERVWGEVSCKKCDGQQRVDIGVEEGFTKVSRFFLSNRDSMHDRAPMVWYSPRLLDCPLCQQVDCVRPIVASKKRAINWLFLLLTQTLGLCTLEQLKYFCKHNRKHRTGAKDRVLYLTYVDLLKQLHPSGPYDL